MYEQEKSIKKWFSSNIFDVAVSKSNLIDSCLKDWKFIFMVAWHKYEHFDSVRLKKNKVVLSTVMTSFW